MLDDKSQNEVSSVSRTHFAALVVALVTLIGIALRFPLGDRLLSWVESQLRIMQEEKQFAAKQ